MKRKEWETITRSGKVQYNIKLNCSCGWGTKGNNTFSPERLRQWGDWMVDWHNGVHYNPDTCTRLAH